jgi:hypothetical protein
VTNPVVPRTPTPVTAIEAKRLIEAERPAESQMTLAMLVAHSWGIENGRGKSIIQHNWGNLTAGSKWTGPIWRPPWFDDPAPDASERIKRLHAAMLAGKAPRAFRAYPSHEAGLGSYLTMLERTFPSMWRAAKNGSITAFAIATKQSGYCPDCEPSSVESTLHSLLTEFEREKLFLFGLPAPSPAPSPSPSPSVSSGTETDERDAELRSAIKSTLQEIEHLESVLKGQEKDHG